MTKKINIKPQILFGMTIAIFVVIILFFTATYPQTMDELRFSHETWAGTFRQIKRTLTTDSPRFAIIIDILLSHYPAFWKILFTALNPFVQLFILLGSFFVITGRKINFKSKEDFYPFFLLVLMYLLVIPSPSNTLFWLTGAMVYSWGFVPPLILLCLFRKSIDGKTLKDSFLNNILMVLCGFTVGMSNENTGPMMFGLTILFLIYCKFKKIKIPKFYYFTLVGIILGITAMFGSGAGAYRAKGNAFLYDWLLLPITDKIILFIGQCSKILNATFWIPIINLFGLLLVLYDKKKTVLKDKDFILSSLFCICAFVLALVFGILPDVLLRVYYSSAVFLFISFIMMLLLVKRLYLINFMKYLALLFLILGVIAGPLIAIPHISLHQQDQYRRSFVKENRKTKHDILFVPRLYVFSAPTENWSIIYYDILWPTFEKQLKREFGGNISFEVPLSQQLLIYQSAFLKKDSEKRK